MIRYRLLVVGNASSVIFVVCAGSPTLFIYSFIYILVPVILTEHHRADFI